MVTKLTKEQEELIDTIREEFIKISRDTTQEIDKKKVEEIWCYFYEKLGRKKPGFWYCDSPMQAQFVIKMLKENTHINIYKNLLDVGIDDNILANCKDKVHLVENHKNHFRTVKNSLPYNFLKNLIYNSEKTSDIKVDSLLLQTIYDIIDRTIPKKIYIKYVETRLKNDISKFVRDMFYYQAKILEKNEYYEIMKKWIELAKNCGYVYAYDNMAFICKKPFQMSFNSSGQIQSISYRDGFKIYNDKNIKPMIEC